MKNIYVKIKKLIVYSSRLERVILAQGFCRKFTMLPEIKIPTRKVRTKVETEKCRKLEQKLEQS